MLTFRYRRVRALSIRLLGSGLAALVLIGCSGAATANPSATPEPSTTSPSPTLVASLVPTESAAAPAPTPPEQTETEWGRIWDELPVDFPAYPGTQPTETGEGPASATLEAGPAKPAEVATFYQAALEVAGFSTISLSGPREDGSWELESAGGAGCHLRTTATPLGASTIVTILYGAECPFD